LNLPSNPASRAGRQPPPIKLRVSLHPFLVSFTTRPNITRIALAAHAHDGPAHPHSRCGVKSPEPLSSDSVTSRQVQYPLPDTRLHSSPSRLRQSGSCSSLHEYPLVSCSTSSSGRRLRTRRVPSAFSLVAGKAPLPKHGGIASCDVCGRSRSVDGRWKVGRTTGSQGDVAFSNDGPGCLGRWDPGEEVELVRLIETGSRGCKCDPMR
jgi:hypothetical protein